MFCFSLSCFSADYKSSFLFINYSFWDLASCSSASIYWLFDTCLSYFKRYRYASCLYSSCEISFNFNSLFKTLYKKQFTSVFRWVWSYSSRILNIATAIFGWWIPIPKFYSSLSTDHLSIDHFSFRIRPDWVQVVLIYLAVFVPVWSWVCEVCESVISWIYSQFKV